MSDFYKKFLMEDVPKVTPGTNKQIFLGAFGKHPGWDDHVEDLGLETGSLVTANTLFYVQCIGGESDAGAWEKLEDSPRLAFVEAKKDLNRPVVELERDEMEAFRTRVLPYWTSPEARETIAMALMKR